MNLKTPIKVPNQPSSSAEAPEKTRIPQGGKHLNVADDEDLQEPIGHSPMRSEFPGTSAPDHADQVSEPVTPPPGLEPVSKNHKRPRFFFSFDFPARYFILHFQFC